MARAAECSMAFGEEEHSRYQEPSAPDSASPIVNGISQVFRVTPAAEAGVDELPAAARAPEIQDWLATHRPAAHVTEYPNGRSVRECAADDGGRGVFTACRIRRRRRSARHACTRTGGGCRPIMALIAIVFKSMFPLVGIRESHRLVGRYVLREQDVRAGLLRQARQEEIIALADHPLDTHGERNVRGSNLKELEQPYGIPYSCLLPNEYDNLIAASRGAILLTHWGLFMPAFTHDDGVGGGCGCWPRRWPCAMAPPMLTWMSTIYGDRSGFRPLLRRRSAFGVCAVDRARSTHGGAVVGGGQWIVTSGL